MNFEIEFVATEQLFFSLKITKKRNKNENLRFLIFVIKMYKFLSNCTMHFFANIISMNDLNFRHFIYLKINSFINTFCTSEILNTNI